MAATRASARPSRPPWAGPGRHPSHHGRPRRRSSDGQVLGALLVVGGAGWLLQQSGVLQLSATTLLSCVLLTLGLGLIVTARSAGGRGLVLIGLVLTVVLASATAVDVGLLQQGVGDRTFAPTTAKALEEPFQLGVGSLTVDLSGVDAEELGGTDVAVKVGVGELVLLLPPEGEVPVRITADARAGEIDLFAVTGSTGDGTNVHRTYADAAAPGTSVLRLDLDVGLGTIQVIRAPGSSRR